MMLIATTVAAALIAGPIAGQPSYATMNEAATAALTQVVSHNTTTEEAGAITQCGKDYHFTSSVGSGEEAKVSDIHIMIPSGCKFVALYHTHPDLHVTLSMSGYLSEADVKLADDLNVISYVMDVGANQIHRYVPHVSKKEWVTMPGTRNQVRVSSGEIL